MRFKWAAFYFVAVLVAANYAGAQAVAHTPPPMGWNSWDSYGLTITEAQFRANVEVLKAKLKPFGWNYAVIDEGWFFENPEARPTPDKLHYALDANGRYVPVPARFPSAVELATKAAGKLWAEYPDSKLPATLEQTSFAELAKWVHAQGLKFGIHIVRGIPRASVERNLPIAGSSFRVQDAADTTDACPWDPTNWGVKDNAAGQAWYDSLLRQYAGWGVDLLKVDCIADRPYKASEIRQIRRAIEKTGRPMVLSLSPGPTNPEHAAEVAELATMWRISDDVWDVWDGAKGFPQTIKGQFARVPWWAHFSSGTNKHPDLDMLPLGELRPSPGWGDPRHTRLTPDEQQTLLTLWAVVQSPLILGANLTQLDEATLKLLTNRELLRIDQRGQWASMPEPHTDRYRDMLSNPPSGLVIMSGSVPYGERDGEIWGWTALFNLSDQPMVVDKTVPQLVGTPAGVKPKIATLKFYDVWAGRSLGTMTGIHLTLPPHGSVLLEER